MKQSSKNVANLLVSAAFLINIAAAATVGSCNALTIEQQNLIGLNACAPTKVTVQAVSESVTEYLNDEPYVVGQQNFITPANLIGLKSGSTNAFGVYEASYEYYNYNQCYNFQPLGDIDVYVNYGQSNGAGLYCYYSNWGCYGEEVCVKNNGVTLVPVSDDVKQTGIKSTMLKRFKNTISQQSIGSVPANAIAWVY